uniref:Uncharacterized protein n=1 Tax=Anopheles albimanus TaxID=7167 RepID=A0A182FQY6_ANOAL
ISPYNLFGLQFFSPRGPSPTPENSTTTTTTTTEKPSDLNISLFEGDLDSAEYPNYSTNVSNYEYSYEESPITIATPNVTVNSTDIPSETTTTPIAVTATTIISNVTSGTNTTVGANVIRVRRRRTTRATTITPSPAPGMVWLTGAVQPENVESEDDVETRRWKSMEFALKITTQSTPSTSKSGRQTTKPRTYTTTKPQSMKQKLGNGATKLIRTTTRRRTTTTVRRMTTTKSRPQVLFSFFGLVPFNAETTTEKIEQTSPIDDTAYEEYEDYYSNSTSYEYSYQDYDNTTSTQTIPLNGTGSSLISAITSTTPIVKTTGIITNGTGTVTTASIATTTSTTPIEDYTIDDNYNHNNSPAEYHHNKSEKEENDNGSSQS